jgi:ribonuclease BN (tRNA processing enzyme)
MTLTFIPLGVGDAFSQKSYSSSLWVSAQGHAILVDCPHPIRKMLHETDMSPKPDLDDVDAVVLTHLHADHVSGLEGYLFYARFHLNRKGLVVAHDKVLEALWPHHLLAGMGRLHIAGAEQTLTLDAYADTRSLDEAAPISVGPFDIACRRTVHHIPTYALRITAGGATLGYSADTTFDPGLIDWLVESDLVIHETNEGIHTPYDKLKSLPEATRAKMRLIHYPDDFDTEKSAIACLKQGQPYTVG